MSAEYVNTLEDIRSEVFNRDGFVGLSLRSWALKMISLKASDYASMFNIGISRIDLTEKARDVEVMCFGRHGEIDMDSLSGGEKVACGTCTEIGNCIYYGFKQTGFHFFGRTNNQFG